MKLTFRGWLRQVYPHYHKVETIINGRVVRNHPIRWHGPLNARGKISDLALSGDFEVEFEFTDAELKNWLEKYIESDPIKAFKLFHSLEILFVKKMIERKTKQ